jgi:hypothetical protein
MNTAERAVALAQAAASFPLLGKVAPEELIDVVRLELGHAEILDGFRAYAGHFSWAIPNDPILHVISGNTPHAGLQSLIRGLFLGAMNFVKLPASGLREVEGFAKMLPSWLKDRLRLGTVTRSLAAEAGHGSSSERTKPSPSFNGRYRPTLCSNPIRIASAWGSSLMTRAAVPHLWRQRTSPASIKRMPFPA